MKNSNKKQCHRIVQSVKNTESINPRVLKTSNGKTMLLSKCTICGNRKSRFLKEQEGKEILSSLGLKIPLSKIPLLDNILFKCNSIDLHKKKKKKNTVNKFVLAGDKFMPKVNSKQTGFTYGACKPFTKDKERIQNKKKKKKGWKQEIQDIFTKMN